ncbi:hypothetical protein GCM10009863_28390 [Streptomyces axinellae]|uniref:Uncharacterized protein n=1 Tax=Streptomyces axinellae TaxID=552788 RepID=A0ABP6CCT7_9ACTN
MLARPAWLPVFALVLLGCWAVFRTFERGRPARTGRIVRGGCLARTESMRHVQRSDGLSYDVR